MSANPGIISMLTLDRLSLTKRAVNSILENSVEDYRLVFLDNGSTDGTLDYLDALKNEYPRRVDVLKSKSNLGVAAGRNRIFKYVISNYGDQFSWILNLDNDCVVHKNYDQAITQSINETGAEVVCPRLIQPDGRIFYNAHSGFLINLEDMQLKLEYADNVDLKYDDSRVSRRIYTDVILGTSAKTPAFLDKVGFYDEGHHIGWEDFSIALKALGLEKNDFVKWKDQGRHFGRDWVSLRELMDDEVKPIAKVVYEPSCLITHDHPVTEEHKDYERVRWKTKTIANSTDHFEKVWGVRPVM